MGLNAKSRPTNTNKEIKNKEILKNYDYEPLRFVMLSESVE